MVQLLVGFLVLINAQLLHAQSITIDGVEQSLMINQIDMKTVPRFDCDAMFNQYDFDQDGVLDDVCVGIEYDPCKPFSWIRPLTQQAMLGGCKSKVQLEYEQFECDGFSPQPEKCQ